MQNYTTQTADIVLQSVLDRNETAVYLRISKGKLDHLNIPKAKIGRRVVFRKSDIEAWLSARIGAQAGGGV